MLSFTGGNYSVLSAGLFVLELGETPPEVLGLVHGFAAIADGLLGIKLHDKKAFLDFPQLPCLLLELDVVLKGPLEEGAVVGALVAAETTVSSNER